MVSFLSRFPAYGSCERPLFVTLAIVTRARNTVPDFLTKTFLSEPIVLTFSASLNTVQNKKKEKTDLFQTPK